MQAGVSAAVARINRVAAATSGERSIYVNHVYHRDNVMIASNSPQFSRPLRKRWSPQLPRPARGQRGKQNPCRRPLLYDVFARNRVFSGEQLPRQMRAICRIIEKRYTKLGRAMNCGDRLLIIARAVNLRDAGIRGFAGSTASTLYRPHGFAGDLVLAAYHTATITAGTFPPCGRRHDIRESRI
jgi:hypothetical protein